MKSANKAYGGQNRVRLPHIFFSLKNENGAFSGTNTSLSRPVPHFLFYAIYTTSVLRKVMLRIQFVCVLSAAVWIE
jgi:hypothetical protein